jgi:outer membrane lipoprotein-sorting protein
VYKVPELGDRTCYKFVRTPYTPHEDDDLNELTLYIDTETWLQVGSVLKNERGELIAEYWFRDVNLNPEFDDDQFTRKAL